MSWLGLPVVEKYKNIFLYGIKLNHAQVIANTTRNDQIGVYSVDDNCYECPYKLLASVSPDHEAQWQVDTTLTSTWRIISDGRHTYMNRNNLNGLICEMRPSLQEFGVYRLNFGTCNLEEEVPPVNTYLPLLLFLLTLMNVGLIYTLVRMALAYSKRKLCPKEQICLDIEKIQPDSEKSLYFFRGILLILLLFTTSGAGGYTSFTNSYGKITLNEYLFFAYIWSLGLKIPSTVGQAIERGYGKRRVFSDILKRSSILIITGVMIDMTISQRVHHEVELWSPLQRAGIAYFAAATAYALTFKKITTPSENIYFKMVASAMSLVWCWVIGIFFFAITLIGMSTVISFNIHPVPYFSATDLVEKSDILSQVTNIQPDHTRSYVNKLFLCDLDFVYMNSYYGFCKGLLGIASSIIQCFIGLKAGSVYLQYKNHGDRIRLWCLWGVVFLVFSVCLVIMSLKAFNLWPVSSIFLVSSFCFFLYTIIYMSTEKTNIITNSTIHSLGVTSVVILCGHLVFSKSIPFSWDIMIRNHLVYLLQNAWVVVLWMVVGNYVAKQGLSLSL